MKAVFLTAPGTFATREVPEPELRAATDVLLRMQCVGVCGSDLHYYRTGRIGRQELSEPWIMGHECTATVAAVGADVQGLAVGDRVAVDPLIACGECDQCRSGRVNTCRRQRFLGCPGQLHGCMAEYLVMPAACCFPVSDRLSAGAAVMVEPFAIALHALHLLGSARDKAIGVLGAGPVGLCVLEALRSAEASAIAMTDRLAYRLELASSRGATSAHLASEAVPELSRLFPAGLDAVFDCSGDQSALDQSLELLAPGGALLLVGIPETDRVDFDINLMRRKEIRIENVRRQNDCTAEAIRLVESGRVELDGIVTHHFDGSASSAAFDTVANYREGVSKALIHFS